MIRTTILSLIWEIRGNSDYGCRGADAGHSGLIARRVRTCSLASIPKSVSVVMDPYGWARLDQISVARCAMLIRHSILAEANDYALSRFR